ncbi:hypothetical protein CR513_53466, partial [Mucuna pruriens]
MNEVQAPEAHVFYSFQIATENVHSECTASCLIHMSKTLHKRSTSSAQLITSFLSLSSEKLLSDLLAIEPHSIGRGPERTRERSTSIIYSSHRYGKFTRRQRLHFGRRGRWTSLGNIPNATLSPMIHEQSTGSRSPCILQLSNNQAERLYSFQITKLNVRSECTASCLIPTSKTLHKMYTSSAPLITSLLSPSSEKLMCHLLAIKPHSIWRGPERGPSPRRLK